MDKLLNLVLPPAARENPANLALLAVCGALGFYLFMIPDASSEEVRPKAADARKMKASAHYSTLPEHHPSTTEFVEYTPRTLALHDGTTVTGGKESRILLAINGRVFDVSSGRHFYGPGGPYGNFAGRDASRGMAKQSFDLDHFAGKYPIVGQLVNEREPRALS